DQPVPAARSDPSPTRPTRRDPARPDPGRGRQPSGMRPIVGPTAPIRPGPRRSAPLAPLRPDRIRVGQECPTDADRPGAGLGPGSGDRPPGSRPRIGGTRPEPSPDPRPTGRSARSRVVAPGAAPTAGADDPPQPFRIPLFQKGLQKIHGARVRPSGVTR